jgi:hypothetical protein
LERLKRLAAISEAIADTGAEGDSRRAAAFVSGTAHQILARVMENIYGRDVPLLGPNAIHPSVAAPLLFLISEQNADAREASRLIQGRDAGDLTRTALIETIHDLASERLEEILQRASRLQRLRVAFDGDPDVAVEQSLYGLCWAGIVHLAAHLLNRQPPELVFRRFDTPQAAFERVEELLSYSIPLNGVTPTNGHERARKIVWNFYRTFNGSKRVPDSGRQPGSHCASPFILVPENCAPRRVQNNGSSHDCMLRHRSS